MTESTLVKHTAPGLCEDCGWPPSHKHHADIHPRMTRWRFDVDGIEFIAVLPWHKWPEEWQDWMRGLVAAQQASEERNNSWMRVVRYVIDAFRPAGKLAEDGVTVLDAAINYRAELGPRYASATTTRNHG